MNITCNILHMFKITSGKLPGNFRKLPGNLGNECPRVKLHSNFR